MYEVMFCIFLLLKNDNNDNSYHTQNLKILKIYIPNAKIIK